MADRAPGHRGNHRGHGQTAAAALSSSRARRSTRRERRSARWAALRPRPRHHPRGSRSAHGGGSSRGCAPNRRARLRWIARSHARLARRFAGSGRTLSTRRSRRLRGQTVQTVACAVSRPSAATAPERVTSPLVGTPRASEEHESRTIRWSSTPLSAMIDADDSNVRGSRAAASPNRRARHGALQDVFQFYGNRIWARST